MLPSPYISFSSYRTPSTSNICLTTFTSKESLPSFSRMAWVICMWEEREPVQSSSETGCGYVSKAITSGNTSSSGEGFERSSSSKKPKSMPVLDGWENSCLSPFWKGNFTGVKASGSVGMNLQLDSSFAKYNIVMLSTKKTRSEPTINAGKSPHRSFESPLSLIKAD